MNERTSRMEYGSGMEAAAAAAIEAAENLCISEIFLKVLSDKFSVLKCCSCSSALQLQRLQRRRQNDAYGTMLAISLNL